MCRQYRNTSHFTPPVGRMSALGQKQTRAVQFGMSAKCRSGLTQPKWKGRPPAAFDRQFRLRSSECLLGGRAPRQIAESPSPPAKAGVAGRGVAAAAASPIPSLKTIEVVVCEGRKELKRWIDRRRRNQVSQGGGGALFIQVRAGCNFAHEDPGMACWCQNQRSHLQKSYCSSFGFGSAQLSHHR